MKVKGGKLHIGIGGAIFVQLQLGSNRARGTSDVQNLPSAKLMLAPNDDRHFGVELSEDAEPTNWGLNVVFTRANMREVLCATPSV